MRRKGIYALVSGLVAIAAVALLLTLVVFPGAAGTGSPGVSAPNVEGAPLVSSAAIAPAVQETASAPGSPREGIKVHGHWTIEVRNPDGSLAERREFDNALAINGGDRHLAWVMGRQYSVGGWEIILWGDPQAFMGSALLFEASFPESAAPNVFRTVTVNVPTSGANAYKLVLSGSATATYNGVVSKVYTYCNLLSSSSPPSSSYPGFPSVGGSFTETTLASPVNLTAGQQVQVTVVLSFS